MQAQIANGTIKELNLLLYQSNFNHWGDIYYMKYMESGYIVNIINGINGIILRCKNTLLHSVDCLPRIHFIPTSRSNDIVGKIFSYRFLSKHILERFQKGSQFVTQCSRRRFAPSPSLVLLVTICWHADLLPPHQPPNTSHILYPP